MKKLLLILSIILPLFSSCAEDYMPVYFPDQEEGAVENEADPSISGVDCTISFTSQLCVVILGDDIDAGIEEPLCEEVDSFPIHISGTEVTLIGSEFPEIRVEGSGLPPLTLDAKGPGTGDNNIGKGILDTNGNIIIENFSMFIEALGMYGEVPGLTFTTAQTEELTHLDPISGSAPDVTGAMTLVTGTVLGPLIDAADEYLMGASLQATFTGSISPTIDECSGSDAEKSIQIKKLFINEQGTQFEKNLPQKNRLELSNTTFIAEDASDIGPKYESTAKFRIKNVSSETIPINISSNIGAFVINSLDSLTQDLSPQQTIVIDITFRPTINNTQVPGEIIEPVIIGRDSFKLIGIAKLKSGLATVSVLEEDGTVDLPDIDDVDIGEFPLPTNSEKEYFQCEEIVCDDSVLLTNCIPCSNDTLGLCYLLTISTNGNPIGAVDSQCSPVENDQEPSLTIDLRTLTDIGNNKKVVIIRNMGVVDLIIDNIHLEEYPGSQSLNQFSISENSFFLSRNFDELNLQETVSPPFSLPSYEENHEELAAYIVITYQPTDLIGADGRTAGIGSSTTDKAILKIKTNNNENLSIEITGETTILEIPDLELYFKTSIGPRKITNNKTFPFRDVTADTTDSAIPLFLKLSDTATNAMRITSISIEGEDSSFFEWMGTSEQINSRTPATDEGKRCSIPIFDPATGDLTREDFDLNPVSLGGAGFDLQPGTYSIDTMPLFGCVNFHRAVSSLTEDEARKTLFKASLIVKAESLDANGNPERNPDGSNKETEMRAFLIAAIDPIKGQVILRITQTSAAMLNPEFPGLSAISKRSEKRLQGITNEADNQIFLAALILDPFDEMQIMDSTGTKVLSEPNDGITAVLRPIDTHPVTNKYNDEFLFDHASLIYDSTLMQGMRGIFEDYPENFPNLPENLQVNGWRIFTSTLSYPGPLGPEDKKPKEISDCIAVNPCDREDLRKFTEAGVGPNDKGACAFFYATGGHYEKSKSFTPEDQGGNYAPLCNSIDQKQDLADIDEGHYSIDGSLTFENIGMRFFGPTFFHNPGGPLGNVDPMDVIFHMAFTTEALTPNSEYEVLPDKKINFSQNEHMINLKKTSVSIPPNICDANTDDREINGETYSGWRYLAPLLSKDEQGLIPTGCPEPNNNFTKGLAYLHGRKLSNDTGIISVVAGAKFGSGKELTFAFQDIMMFIALNGWLCDPNNIEDPYEGEHCYDKEFNDRDELSQISIME